VNEYDFADRLAFSQGQSENTHPETIRRLIAGCVNVEKAPLEYDKRGIDFVATLRKGATLNIDIKAREFGCSKYWRRDNKTGSVIPDLALEIWSVVPERNSKGAVGWSLDESKLTDYTLHIYDPKDCQAAFLMPFQLLRMSFRKNFQKWTRRYRVARQSSGSWKSECVFVPSTVVVAAITSEIQVQIEEAVAVDS